MLPEFPSAAQISEYVCDLEYLFSRMNVGSYGATAPHLWLMSKIPQRTGMIAALPLRGRVGPTRTMNWWTSGLSWLLRERMTPTWSNS